MPVLGTDPFTLLEAGGTVAFGFSGAAVAVRAGMDWLGVVVLAVVTAVGGGTLRDLLLGDTPVWWIERSWPLVLAVTSALVVIVVGHRVRHVALDSQRSVLLADAVGLAAFTVSGTLVSLTAGVPPWTAVVLGVVTGAGGGVLRDVLAQRRPLILVGQIYALAALAGASLVVALVEADVSVSVARWPGVAVIVLVRLAAIRWGWSLPRVVEAPTDAAD